MKKNLLIAAQLVTLAGAALVLMATSRADNCTVGAEKRFAVTSTCGPAAYVTVSNDASCTISTGGAADANLPATGDALGTDFESGFQLFEPSQALADGGREQPTLSAPNPDGGEPLAFRLCNVAAASPDGAERTVHCYNGNADTGVVCDGTFVENGTLPVPDAGTVDGGN